MESMDGSTQEVVARMSSITFDHFDYDRNNIDASRQEDASQVSSRDTMDKKTPHKDEIMNKNAGQAP
jgi:hypothetical protein